MSLSPVPTTDQLSDRSGLINPSYRTWFASIQTWLGPQGRTGATGARPQVGLYPGLQYFDTTLGYPVFVKTVGTNKPGNATTVWVNASGGTV